MDSVNLTIHLQALVEAPEQEGDGMGDGNGRWDTHFANTRLLKFRAEGRAQFKSWPLYV